MDLFRKMAGLRLALAPLVLGGALAGCATAPIPHEVDRTQTYADKQDVIWQRAVAFFAAHNLSIKTIDKASGLIAADRSVSVPSAGLEGYADCGTAPLLRRVAQTIDLNLFVRSLDDGRTSVTVNTRFTETRILGYNTMTLNTVTCVSTGQAGGRHPPWPSETPMTRASQRRTPGAVDGGVCHHG